LSAFDPAAKINRRGRSTTLSRGLGLDPNQALRRLAYHRQGPLCPA
jgi:hypothetical protein